MSSNEQTVPILYEVFCGKIDTKSYDVQEISFVAQAPVSICNGKRPNQPGPELDAVTEFTRSLEHRYTDDIFFGRIWQCSICGREAKELLHVSLPLLWIGEEAAPGVQRRVIDHAVPICRSGGKCDREAEEDVTAFNKKQMAGGMTNIEIAPSWNRCGKTTGVKLCSGCKVLAYCSKESQTESWPGHKKQCKRAQAENRAAAT